MHDLTGQQELSRNPDRLCQVVQASAAVACSPTPADNHSASRQSTHPARCAVNMLAVNVPEQTWYSLPQLEWEPAAWLGLPQLLADAQCHAQWQVHSF